MAISYSVTQKKNPKDAMAAPKWYANAQVKANYTIDDLASDVEKATTLSEGEVNALIKDMLHFIERALERGESVQLGDLGSFAIGLSSTGADTMEAFDASYISKARVSFRAGRRLTEMCKRLQFEKTPARPHV